MDKFRPKATARQREYIRRLGLSFPDNVSVGEANRLIQGRTGTSNGYKRIKLNEYVYCARHKLEGNVVGIKASGELEIRTSQGMIVSRLEEVVHVGDK